MNRPTHVCRWLDNKEYALPPLVEAAKPDDGPEPEPGTPFSCGKSNEAFGPDGAEACPADCVRGRICFEPQQDTDLTDTKMSLS